MINFDVLSLTFEQDNPDFDPTKDILGAGKLAFLVPDCPFGIDLKRAGFIHDYRWDTAISLIDYFASAHEFEHNVYLLCVAHMFSGVWGYLNCEPLHTKMAVRLSSLYGDGVSNIVSEHIFKLELAARGILLDL